MKYLKIAAWEIWMIIAILLLMSPAIICQTPKPTSKPAVKTGPIKKIVKVDPEKEVKERRRFDMRIESLRFFLDEAYGALRKEKKAFGERAKRDLLIKASANFELAQAMKKMSPFKKNMEKYAVKSTSGLYYYYIGKADASMSPYSKKPRDLYLQYNPTKVEAMAVKIEEIVIVDAFGDKPNGTPRGKVGAIKPGEMTILDIDPVGGFIEKAEHMKVVSVRDKVIWKKKKVDKPTTKK